MSEEIPQRHEANRAFYDRISTVYDHLADSNERAARLAGIQALEVKPGERTLEVGFGTGNEVLDLADLVEKGGTVAGIDISPGMLAVSQGKVAERTPQATIDLRVGDARQLPWPDESFDAVYSSFTLELFLDDDIPVVLREMKRVLRKGGRTGVVSMAKVQPGERASVLEHVYIWMHRHFPHIVDCRPIDVEAVVAQAGLRITKRTDLVIWTLPVAMVIAVKD